jgi:hypothetical protein
MLQRGQTKYLKEVLECTDGEIIKIKGRQKAKAVRDGNKPEWNFETSIRSWTDLAVVINTYPDHAKVMISTIQDSMAPFPFIYSVEEVENADISLVPEDGALFWAIALHPNRIVEVRDNASDARKLLFLSVTQKHDNNRNWQTNLQGVLNDSGINMRTGKYTGLPCGALTCPCASKSARGSPPVAAGVVGNTPLSSLTVHEESVTVREQLSASAISVPEQLNDSSNYCSRTVLTVTEQLTGRSANDLRTDIDAAANGSGTKKIEVTEASAAPARTKRSHLHMDWGCVAHIKPCGSDGLFFSVNGRHSHTGLLVNITKKTLSSSEKETAKELLQKISTLTPYQILETLPSNAHIKSVRNFVNTNSRSEGHTSYTETLKMHLGEDSEAQAFIREIGSNHVTNLRTEEQFKFRKDPKTKRISLYRSDDTTMNETLPVSTVTESTSFFAAIFTNDGLRMYKRFGVKAYVGLDATHSVAGSRLAVSTANVIANTAVGYPAYVFLHELEDEVSVIEGLALLHYLAGEPLCNPDPDSIMTDKSQVEMNAIAHVFPQARSILCYTHALKAFRARCMQVDQETINIQVNTHRKRSKGDDPEDSHTTNYGTPTNSLLTVTNSLLTAENSLRTVPESELNSQKTVHGSSITVKDAELNSSQNSTVTAPRTSVTLRSRPTLSALGQELADEQQASIAKALVNQSQLDRKRKAESVKIGKKVWVNTVARHFDRLFKCPTREEFNRLEEEFYNDPNITDCIKTYYRTQWSNICDTWAFHKTKTCFRHTKALTSNNVAESFHKTMKHNVKIPLLYNTSFKNFVNAMFTLFHRKTEEHRERQIRGSKVTSVFIHEKRKGETFPVTKWRGMFGRTENTYRALVLAEYYSHGNYKSSTVHGTDNMYNVHNWRDDVYTVDINTRRCSCQSFHSEGITSASICAHYLFIFREVLKKSIENDLVPILDQYPHCILDGVEDTRRTSTIENTSDSSGSASPTWEVHENYDANDDVPTKKPTKKNIVTNSLISAMHGALNSVKNVTCEVAVNRNDANNVQMQTNFKEFIEHANTFLRSCEDARTSG